MATFTAVGPALNIDGPLPVAPPYRLLSVDGVLAGSDRWLNGVNVWGYPLDVPSGHDPCGTGTFGTKDDFSDMPVPRFDSFTAYLPIVCKSGWAGDPEAFSQRAADVLRATLSYPVEEQLARGAFIQTNPYLGDSNLTILGSGAVAPSTGLAFLSDAIGETGREGMILMPPSIASYLGFDALNTDGTNIYVQGTGMPVAVCDGLIGTDPDSGTSPTAGKTWMFATGPVRAYVSDVELIPTTPGAAMDLTDNQNVLTYRAEADVLVEWDTALQAGVLVDWSS